MNNLERLALYLAIAVSIAVLVEIAAPYVMQLAQPQQAT